MTRSRSKPNAGRRKRQGSRTGPSRSPSLDAPVAPGTLDRGTRILRRTGPIVIVLLAIGTYLNADHEEFLFDSSNRNIQRPEIRDLSFSVDRWLHRFVSPGDNEFSVMTFALSYAINVAFGRPGFDVTGFLIFNVVLHALTAAGVFALVRRLLLITGTAAGPALWIAFAGGCVFAVHPILAAGIAYVAQRRGLMTTLFYVAATLAYLVARQTPPSVPDRPTAGQWPWWRILSALAVPICFVLAYTSKVMGMTLPLMLLALELTLRADDLAALRRFRWILGIGIGLSVAGLFAFAWSRGLISPEHGDLRIEGHDQWGTGVHFLTASRAFVHYWKLIILPLPAWSCVDHSFEPSKSMGFADLLAVAMHLVIISLGALAAMRGRKLAAIGIFWFYITLLPYWVIAQVEVYVEYKLYLPMVGAICLLAELLLFLRSRMPSTRLAIVTGLVTVVLLATTISRNTIYQSRLNFWADVLKKYPDRPRPLTDYALALQNDFDPVTGKRRVAEAIPYYRRALEVAPDYPIAHSNLGNALVILGQLDEAIKHLRISVSGDDDYATGHNNLGRALTMKGLHDEAEICFRKAIELDPRYASPHSNLGNILASRGLFDEAVAEYETAIRLDPDQADTYNNLATVFIERGQFPRAMEYLNEALTRRPNYADARHNLLITFTRYAAQFHRNGQLDEARAYYDRALQLDPNFVPAQKGRKLLDNEPGR